MTAFRAPTSCFRGKRRWSAGGLQPGRGSSRWKTEARLVSMTEVSFVQTFCELTEAGLPQRSETGLPKTPFACLGITPRVMLLADVSLLPDQVALELAAIGDDEQLCRPLSARRVFQEDQAGGGVAEISGKTQRLREEGRRDRQKWER